MVNLNKLKECAKAKGWSLSFLCEKLGLSKSYFTDVKNGKTIIPEARLQMIASMLDTSVDFLTDVTDKKENPLAQFSPETVTLVERISKLSPDQMKQALEYIDFISQKK